MLFLSDHSKDSIFNSLFLNKNCGKYLNPENLILEKSVQLKNISGYKKFHTNTE